MLYVYISSLPQTSLHGLAAATALPKLPEDAPDHRRDPAHLLLESPPFANIDAMLILVRQHHPLPHGHVAQDGGSFDLARHT